MAYPFDTSKSLEQLDGEDWGEPLYPSHLVTTCHRLRRVPLREFTLEDLRIMIGQGISLDELVPLALTRLSEVPLAEGDFYPGDLLHAVMTATPAWWMARPALTQQARRIAARALDTVDAFKEQEAAGEFVSDCLPPDTVVEELRTFLAVHA